MLDLRCYLVTGQGDPRATVELCAEAAAGGAGVIQVRSKPISVRALTELTVAIAEAVARANPATRVLVDDRVDVAAALMGAGHNVHGVHIGQDDLEPRLARQVLGRTAIIGLTTGTRELVDNANTYKDVIDYIGCGPFQPTPTKDSGREPIGLAGYPELVAASELPMVAIGGVNAEDAADLAAVGVDGVAIVRGFINSPDPRAMAAGIVADFEQAASR